ncbi:MAG: histidine--tRNA ligase [Mucinivorans sp.]
MKPSIPKGMRDFSPVEMARRNYIFQTVRSIFELYGFQAIETPAMENLSSLLGKYGDEGDKLLFKVLNSGDYAGGMDIAELSKASNISDKGLRYDLTVPFARYVVQHQNELTFPFKRYQIQPVWRADRPQKGRYREFTQCDVDVVGTDSLLCEMELVQIVYQVFERLGVRVVLKMNNRKILYGIAGYIGFADKMTDITVAIDKLDKIGLENVNTELLERGLSQEAIDKLQPILLLKGSNEQKIASLEQILVEQPIGLKGVQELKTILAYTASTPIELQIDLSLARGLNYYTGAIFEVKALDWEIGSICGGGRYDDLTGIFGLSGLSGVGISFGADRIYDVLLGLGLFPAEALRGPRALFVNFGPSEEKAALSLLGQLRQAGVATEIYPSSDKLKKQFDYATKKGIEYMIFMGQDEIASQMVTIKNINTGKQQQVPNNEVVKLFCK